MPAEVLERVERMAMSYSTLQIRSNPAARAIAACAAARTSVSSSTGSISSKKFPVGSGSAT